jgi:L-lactate dehydrogenase (cytochrome)
MLYAYQLSNGTGETNITQGIASHALVQVVSSHASCSYADIIASSSPGQTLFFQLYKNANDMRAEERVREAETLGYKAIWLTVDALVWGNRERDVRALWEIERMEGHDVPEFEDDVDVAGTAGELVQNDDRDMTWEKVVHIPSFGLFPRY